MHVTCIPHMHLHHGCPFGSINAPERRAHWGPPTGRPASGGGPPAAAAAWVWACPCPLPPLPQAVAWAASVLRGRLLKLAPWRLLCWRSPGRRLRDATQSCQAEQANVVPIESGADAGENVAFHLLSDIEPCTGLGRVACWCVLGMAKTTSEDAAQSSLLKLSRCSEYRRWTIDKAANASSGWLLSPAGIGKGESETPPNHVIQRE